VDYAGHFQREAAAFEAAARQAAGAEAAPGVPSCPGWTVTDLVLHLGMVHRVVARVIGERMQRPPAPGGDPSWLCLAEEWNGWLPPRRAPEGASLPAGLLDWFGAGAAGLAEHFHAAEPGEPVWTWSPDHSVGFWQRMQAIEAAVHRWDAENAVGTAQPLAADAVAQTFEVMAPWRRAVAKAPPGQGERFLLRRTDGPQTWAVQFEGDTVQLGAPDDQHDIQISGTASDLALFLWQRKVADRLDVQGDISLLSGYFVLVPPL